ncbi:MAG: helix-turn-helix transcriptional regulator [Oscillospiraceae bacterium]|nr:helix-turn-helix transcriptional regulator [Oscillospiraceae bacterium]
MSSALFDYEWQFMIQLISRVTYCVGYEETCQTLLQQLKTLIPFSTAVVFRTGRENGQAVIGNPISYDADSRKSDHSRFINGDYPRWSEFIMASYSTVFRQSDLIAPAKWERTRVYRDIWQPQNIYWGLFASIVAKDVPMVIIGLFREKKDEDFSARDIYLFNTLKDPLERKFYAMLEGSGNAGRGMFFNKIAKTAAKYSLTKRETEIVNLVCSSKSGDEICGQLFITPATLSKHLSNIYAKTGVRNRTQLFALFNEG